MRIILATLEGWSGATDVVHAHVRHTKFILFQEIHEVKDKHTHIYKLVQRINICFISKISLKLFNCISDITLVDLLNHANSSVVNC